MVTDEQVRNWLEKFDNNDSSDLIADILNNKIKLEVMVDSVLDYWHGEPERAIKSYEEMWR
tara:strand:+ start:4059 stop:4241 length:183 start_codon:yes stop_codon:yes gene_type:complete